MNFISGQLDIKLLQDIDSSTPCLYFKFKGKFTEQASISGCKTWAAEMDAMPNLNFDMVWDCSEMDGFEMNARKEWYNCMMTYKGRIAKVHVIGGSLMIRSAAKVMLNFFNINSDIHRQKSELPVGYQ